MSSFSRLPQFPIGLHKSAVFTRLHWTDDEPKVRLPATWLRGHFEPRFSLALARKDLGRG